MPSTGGSTAKNDKALDLTRWEGRRFPPVTRINAHRAPSFRRIAALLAMLALIYAGGFAGLAHAAGLPMTMPAVATHDHDSAPHAAMDHGDMEHGAMDHGAMDHGAQSDPAAPCDTGCALCKDCALCLFTGLPVLMLPSAALQFTDYRPLAAVLHGGIRPDLPAEPPRV